MVKIITTTNLPAQDQLAFWERAVSDNFIQLQVTHDKAPESFQGQITQYSHNDITLADVMADGHSARRTRPMMEDDGKDYCMLVIQRGGTSRVEQFKRLAIMHPGDIVLFDSSQDYLMQMPGYFRHEVMMLPGSLIRSSMTKSEQHMARLLPWQSGSGQLFTGFLRSLRNTMDSLEKGAACTVTNVLVELLCAVVRNQPILPETSSGGLRHYHLERLREYVLQHLGDPELSIENISQALQLSVRYLHLLFDDQPLTLNKWVWKMRLEAAHRLLSEPAGFSTSITEVAFSVGFRSSAHFSRQFLMAFGVTPRDHRHCMQEKYDRKRR